ncbi:MAG: SpaA isopeptide-forming pilin-related protein [bacterium]|nr:SpaA isopeptide-forming pilin-related protein [bacterium]
MKGKKKNKENPINNQKWLFLGVAILLITIVSCLLINVTFKNKDILGTDKNATTAKKYDLKARKATGSLYKLYDFTGKTLKLNIKNKVQSVKGDDKGYILYKDSESKSNYVYCIELGVRANTSIDYDSKDKSSYFDGLNDAAKDAIKYINIFGYPGVDRSSLVKEKLSSSDKNNSQLIKDIQYLATQTLIWEFQQGWRDNYNVGIPQYTDASTQKLTTNATAKLIYNQTIGSGTKIANALKAVHDKILTDITDFKKMPSVASKSTTVKAKTIPFNSYGKDSGSYELIIDAGMSLSGIDVSCKNDLGVKCSITSDKKGIRVTASKAITKNVLITLTKTKKSEVSTTQTGLSFIDNGGAGPQRLVVGLVNSKTIKRYINVTTEKLGSITIQKTTADAETGTFTFRITGDINNDGKTDSNEYKDVKITTKVSGDGSSGTVTIKNLPLKKYTITEINIPTKYTSQDPDIADLTKNNNYTTKFYNRLKTAGLRIIKVNNKNKQISGATLKLTDSNGNIVGKEWTTAEKEFSGTSALEVGTYKLCETKAPAGYIKSDECYDIRISGTKTASIVEYKKVSETKWTTGNEIKFVNQPTKVIIKKVDKDGNCVEGATLKLLKDGKQVGDTWNTCSYEVEGLIEGATYTIEEVTAPSGYLYINKNGENKQNFVAKNGVTISVKDDKISIKIKKVSSNSKYTIKDGTLLLALCPVNVDCRENADERIEQWTTTEYEIKDTSKLIAGQKYKIVEITPPPGFNLAADKTITINKYEKVQTFEIENTPTTVTFSKQDATTGKEIAGAHLQIIDTNGNIVDEWESEEGKSHIVTGVLDYGKMYTLIETIAPNKYAVSKEQVEFWVPTTKPVVMKNKLTEVIIRKIDANTNETLSGAKLQLIDSDGNQMDWTSTKDGYKFEGLQTGKKYTIREIEAPNGYEKSKDITFTLADDEQTRTIDVPNTPIVYVPDTASDSTIINIIIGAILVLGGTGAIIFIRKGMEQN